MLGLIFSYIIKIFYETKNKHHINNHVKLKIVFVLLLEML